MMWYSRPTGHKIMITVLVYGLSFLPLSVVLPLLLRAGQIELPGKVIKDIHSVAWYNVTLPGCVKSISSFRAHYFCWLLLEVASNPPQRSGYNCNLSWITDFKRAAEPAALLPWHFFSHSSHKFTP